MNTRPFWHYCEVCGKKEFITAQDAFDSGWDYPPNIGDFGILSARTCGSCRMVDTLYWKINTGQRTLFVTEGDEALTLEEFRTWERIRREPKSLLQDEEETSV